MSHFAELDDNNVVLRVLVGNNSDPEEGYQWLVDNLGGRWVKTSYNGNIRMRFAGIGYYYDEKLDAFIAPQPFSSWVLDIKTADWVAPTARPDSGVWIWDESHMAWVEPDVN